MADTPALPAKKKRPVALIVISIIGLIYAASSMASAVQSAIYAPLMSVFGSFMNGMYRSLDYSSPPDYFGVIAGLAPALLLLAAIRLPVNVFGLIACIGALKNKPWTRSGVTTYSVLLFVEAAAAALILILMINPVIDELQQVYGMTFGGMGSVSSFFSTYFTIIKAMVIVTLPLSCVLPAIMLVIFNKPAVKEHYREIKGTAA